MNLKMFKVYMVIQKMLQVYIVIQMLMFLKFWAGFIADPFSAKKKERNISYWSFFSAP